MKNRTMYKKAFSIVTLLILVFSYQNCGSREFSAVENKNTLSSVEEQFGLNGQKRIKLNYNRETTKESGDLDIVWVIDNSGSMRAEAAHVRNNFENFIRSLDQKADTKVALISAIGDNGTAVDFPGGVFDASKHLRLNQRVSSTNALSLIDQYLERLNTSFFRKEAKKAFIIVTDDNSSLSQQDFLSRYSLKQDTSNTVFYNFVGLGRSQSSCQARTGAEYISLSNNTGGQLFNICDQDWSQNYNILIEDIIKQASTEFFLGAAPKDNIQVFVNGVETTSFSFVEDTLHVSPEAFKDLGSYNIRIEFDINQSQELSF